MAEENQSAFKVTDRRLFNSDGTLRDDAQIEQAPAPQPAPELQSAQPTSTSSGVSGFPNAGPETSPQQFSNQLPDQLSDQLPAPDQFPGQFDDQFGDQGFAGEMPEQTMFTEFLMNIASSAFIYLGLVEHPATGRRQVEMQAAKESIDMLSMLRDKTKGNLTPGEESFFDDLLGDLRMQFVSMKKQ